MNGPLDAQVGINFALQPGTSYRFYTFAQTLNLCTSAYDGLNLFFDGNESTPGISVFGPVNTTTFQRNGNTTYTLGVLTVPGANSTTYSSGGVTVVLNGFDWNTPAAPPGDVCQTFAFIPNANGEADLFGSFSLRVFRTASVQVAPSKWSSNTLSIIGHGFGPGEIVSFRIDDLNSANIGTAITDEEGSLFVTIPRPTASFSDLYAMGETSGNLGVSSGPR